MSMRTAWVVLYKGSLSEELSLANIWASVIHLVFYPGARPRTAAVEAHPRRADSHCTSCHRTRHHRDPDHLLPRPCLPGCLPQEMRMAKQKVSGQYADDLFAASEGLTACQSLMKCLEILLKECSRERHNTTKCCKRITGRRVVGHKDALREFQNGRRLVHETLGSLLGNVDDAAAIIAAWGAEVAVLEFRRKVQGQEMLDDRC